MATGAGVLQGTVSLAKGARRKPAAMVVVTAILVAGTYLWQHTQVNARQVALDRAVSSGEVAHGQVSTLEGQAGDLQGRIEALQSRVDAAQSRLHDVSSGKQHVAAQLRRSQARLDQATARMTALLGAPIADGRYFGEIVVVGANQTPQRLVIDLQRWLTGDAAQAAEAEYGIPPDARYDIFVENESPAWHTVEISSSVAVSIIDMDSAEPLREVGTGLVGTERISLGRFAKMMSLNRLSNPFWIDVSGGRVTGIQEEYTE